MVPPGWFGKLSCLGDFATRRLTPDCVQLCDDWLSVCLERSRAQLGGLWLDAYLSAPLWRFAWAPGIVDARWWRGVLMPSCDNVGRYFPLLVMQPQAVPPAPGALDGWYAALARAATDTLDDRASLGAFEAALGGLPAYDGAVPGGVGALAEEERRASFWWLPGGAAPLRCSGLPDPADFAALLQPP